MARLEALLQVHRGEGLASLLGRVDATVRAHRGPREAADDATMVALRFSGATLPAATLPGRALPGGAA